MVNQKVEMTNQEIHMIDRAKGYVTGVIDVVSFDLEEIVLETVAGILKIKGNKLHVKTVNLDKRVVEFEGNIESSQKCGYDHFMLKEIHEQPQVFLNTVSFYLENNLNNYLNYGLVDQEHLRDRFLKYRFKNKTYISSHEIV